MGNVIDCSNKIKNTNKSNANVKSRLEKAKIKIRKTGVDCSATKIMGIDGTCINKNPSALNSYMPSDFSLAWGILQPVISHNFPAGPQMCFGDFRGSAFDENEDLGTDLCNTIPVEEDGYFGVIGISVPQLPCGALTDVNMCVAFDKCGTFALAFNGGVPACLTFYAGAFTGVVAAAGAAASTIADTVGNFSIGISIGRRFTTDVRVAYRDGDNVHSDTITTYGHIFVDIGINLPTDFLKFGKKDLSQYFSLSADILFLLDFGDVDTVVNSMINSIKTMTKDSAKTLLNSIIKSGAELTLNIDGVLTLGLEDMTGGILADFSFTLASATVLLTGGSGRSGLEAGIYFRLSSNIISDMINSLTGVMNGFSDIFAKLGFDDIQIPSVGIELGLFISTSAFGFQFTFVGFVVKCMFVYNGSHFSCSINAKIFTLILEGLNFVFKQAAKFFDQTGKIIATKVAADFKAATKAISQGVKQSVGFVKNSAGALVKLGTEQFTDLKNEFEENLKWLKNGYKNASTRASKVLGEVANVAKKKAEILACDVKYVLNKKKRRKCKNKVKDKYDNDSNNKILSCSDNEYKFTTFTDVDSGNVYKLISHAMTCDSNQFISEFKLERKDSTMRYRYKCVTLPSITSTCYTGTTAANIVSSDYYHSAHYLDRHSVACKDGYALNDIALKSDTTGKIYYAFTCCSFPVDSCDWNETQNEDRGDNSTFNLDRLYVNAGDYRLLAGFKLQSPGDEQWNYTYKSCGTTSNVKTSYDTGCNDDGDGSIFYLDRHEVSCGKGNAVNSFIMKREDGTIRYNYYCIYKPDSISTDCTTYTTPENSTKSGDSTHSTHYLDRHDVNCPDNTVLNYFKLMRNSSKIYYKYTCCKATINTCTEWYTSWKDGGNYQNYYLDRQDVNATGSNVLGRFWMDTDDGNWRYKIQSCSLK